MCNKCLTIPLVDTHFVTFDRVLVSLFRDYHVLVGNNRAGTLAQFVLLAKEKI